MPSDSASSSKLPASSKPFTINLICCGTTLHRDSPGLLPKLFYSLGGDFKDCLPGLAAKNAAGDLPPERQIAKVSPRSQQVRLKPRKGQSKNLLYPGTAHRVLSAGSGKGLQTLITYAMLQIQQAEKLAEGRSIVLNLVGFSRGAVLPIVIANRLRKRTTKFTGVVNILAIEPVKGPAPLKPVEYTYVPAFVQRLLVLYGSLEDRKNFIPIFPNEFLIEPDVMAGFIILPGLHNDLTNARGEMKNIANPQEKAGIQRVYSITKLLALGFLCLCGVSLKTKRQDSKNDRGVHLNKAEQDALKTPQLFNAYLKQAYDDIVNKFKTALEKRTNTKIQRAIGGGRSDKRRKNFKKLTSDDSATYANTHHQVLASIPIKPTSPTDEKSIAQDLTQALATHTPIFRRRSSETREQQRQQVRQTLPDNLDTITGIDASTGLPIYDDMPCNFPGNTAMTSKQVAKAILTEGTTNSQLYQTTKNAAQTLGTLHNLAPENTPQMLRFLGCLDNPKLHNILVETNPEPSSSSPKGLD